MIPLVVASERGKAQTAVQMYSGVGGAGQRSRKVSRIVLERQTRAGDSPVGENQK